MNRPRWRKVLHDLWGGKFRTLLVVLTISVGVFAVGFVSDMLFVFLDDMDVDYQMANPHAAVIYTDVFDDDLLPVLQRVDGVGLVEGRSSVSGRTLRNTGEKVAISVTGIPGADQIKIDTLRPAEIGGTIPPLLKGDIYLERSAKQAVSAKVGDTIDIELSDGRIRPLRVVAFVHDVTAIPFNFANQLYAYALPETLAALGGSEDYNQLLLTVAEKKMDEEHVRDVSEALGEKIKETGRSVYFTFIYQPGRHFASDITRALGTMMMVLGILAVFLGSFLVINTINALIGQQIRQIGVMKAIGARTDQLLGMYILLIVGFGILALLIAMPLEYLLSSSSGNQIGDYLNVQVSSGRMSIEGIFLQLFVAIVVPLGAALAPVLKGAHITVREAITSYGLGQQSFGNGLLDRLIERIRGLPRPLLISLRNTFRRKARLALTLSTLVMAGAIFIGVFNLRASLSGAINETFGYLLTDINLSFSRAYREEKLVPLAMSVPGVVGAEAWGGADASVLSEGDSVGTQISIVAPPSGSTLIDPTLTAGRWLLPEDENALVIGNHLTAVRPELKVGDEITLSIDDKESKWKIVGIYRMAGNVVPPLVYANKEYLTRLQHHPGITGNLRLITEQHDAVSQRRISKQLERIYADEGIELNQAVIGADLIAANVSQTDVLVYFLMVMAILIAVVGGLGLASTMSMNVLERTREIGVMRAIGARNGSVFQLVLVEGLFIGILSWILGAILAVPIGSGLAYAVGISMLQSPLDFAFSMDGFILWLILVLIISTFASLLPARNAVRLTIREVLAYE